MATRNVPNAALMSRYELEDAQGVINDAVKRLDQSSTMTPEIEQACHGALAAVTGLIQLLTPLEGMMAVEV